MRQRVLTGALAGGVALGMLGAPNAPAAQARGHVLAGGDPISVGLITSKTGLLAEYGAEYLRGFYAGLSYATGGTGSVGGHKIQISEYDDAGTPATAVSTAKGLIGKGYKIIAGSASSGVALQLASVAAQNRVLFISGPAAADEITGINKYTFRSGRQSYQDVRTASLFLGSAKRQKVTVFAQDSAFGQANVAAVKGVIGGQGATVSSVLVPPTSEDFIPFALRAKQAKPSLLFVAWAGANAAAMWQALDQQGVLKTTKVVTGLANSVTYGTYGSATTKIQFLSHYFYQAPDNKVNSYLVSALKKKGATPDLFDPDGFVAAQMIVRAVQRTGGSDVDAMVKSLEGYSFAAPKGQETVRASDHALLQPMFQARLVGTKTLFEPKLIKALSPSQVAPPVKK